MNYDHVFKFLDKPETVQTVSFLLTKWRDENGRDMGSSILKTDGCCLSTVFDKDHRETFKNWADGEARLNNLIAEYKSKGFRSRDELGIKPVGKCHDEEVLSIRQQIVNIYFDALQKRMYIPAIYDVRYRPSNN